MISDSSIFLTHLLSSYYAKSVSYLTDFASTLIPGLIVLATVIDLM